MTPAPTTAREALLMAETEAQFQDWVISYARVHGWKVGHFSDSRREVMDKRTGARKLVGDKDAADVPDLILLRRGVSFLAELKSMTGKVRRGQQEWIDQGAKLWRPCDRDEIEMVLR